MALTLTARQAEILEFIQRFTEENGYPPSGRELSDVCGLGGPSGAHRMIGTLERKGFIERDHGRNRGVVVIYPSIDVAVLDRGDVIRLVTMSKLHEVFSNLGLSMAMEARRLDVRETLISEALKRTRRMLSLRTMFGAQLDALPDVSEHIAGLHEFVLPGRPRAWHEHLVDQCVFNKVFASLMSAVADGDAVRRAVLWPDICIGKTASSTAERWLNEVLAEDERVRHHCNDRAVSLTASIADMLASIDAAHGEGEFSPEFEPPSTPPLATISA